MPQSNNSDVKVELDIMLTHPKRRHSLFMLVEKDGLLVSRINRALARNSRKYIWQAPAIIPVQGEHPHGTCHVLHTGWRPLDPVWPECVAFLHTDAAHTMQYVPMVFLRVLWTEALHPALAHMYHRNRTISLIGMKGLMKGSNVGWEMPIEKNGLAIANNVTNASRESITKVAESNAVTAHMYEQLDGCLAALQSLDDNPNTVKKDEAAWRRTTPSHLMPSNVKHACVHDPAASASTMRPRRTRDALPQATWFSGKFAACICTRAKTWSGRNTCGAH
eukprot:6189666-Pleurochrysis_carterae.AAC.3